MVTVPKSTEKKVCICVDFTKLNQSVKRERHMLPAVERTLGQLQGAKVFSKLDANSGFWQIPLAKESALLTTFITPFGRFCFNRLCFGISSAPEHFQKRMSQKGRYERTEGTETETRALGKVEGKAGSEGTETKAGNSGSEGNEENSGSEGTETKAGNSGSE